MRGVADYAVVYDITSDAERSRVDRTLKDFGFRVQKSVFECRLNKKGKEELIRRLHDLDIKTGFIKERTNRNNRDCQTTTKPAKEQGHGLK